VYECRVDPVHPTQIQLRITRPKLQSCLPPAAVEKHALLPVLGLRVFTHEARGPASEITMSLPLSCREPTGIR